MTEETVLSGYSPKADQLEETEYRKYELNRGKAVQKKLKFTERECITITETKGGIKAEFNTGTYEIFRKAVHEYITADEQNFCVQHTEVKDKAGNVVECKYRLSKSKSSYYTINLYHSKCSTLVNGKQSNQFLRKDLPNILSFMESWLAEHNCTLNDINQSAKYFTLNYLSSNVQVSPFGNNRSTNMSSEDFLPLSNSSSIMSVADTIGRPNVPECQVSDEPDRSNSTSTARCEGSYESLVLLNSVCDIVRNVLSNVQQLTETLDKHICNQDMKFGQIENQIQSLKFSNATHSNHVQNQIESLEETTKNVMSQLKQSTSTIQNNIQSFSDKLKMVSSTSGPVKSSTQEPDRTRPKTPVIFSRPNNQERIEETVNISPSLSPSSNSVPTRKKTLIIGDSILRGINQNGLRDDTEVTCIPGGRMVGRNGIQSIGLTTRDLEDVSDIVVHISGNDVANHTNLTSIRDELVRSVTYLKKKYPLCKFHICSVCPRKDVSVEAVNQSLLEICADHDLNYINCYNALVYGDGSRVRQFYHMDGIHLNSKGTSTLLKTIDKSIPVIRKRKSSRAQQANGTYNKNRNGPVSYEMRQLETPRFHTRRVKSPKNQQQYRPKSHEWWFPCSNCGRNNHKTDECYAPRGSLTYNY